MRLNYLILTFIVSVVLLLQFGCQEQFKVAEEPGKPVTKAPAVQETKVEAAPEPNKPAPKITFDDVVYDFGEIGPGVKKAGEIRFTNTGDDLLKITKVERCCGVFATLDKNEYAPGESGVLKINYTARNVPGMITRRMYVNSNDEQTPKVTLTVKAMIVEKVASDPKRLKLFLKEENAGCPKITLTSLDDQPFSITGFSSTAEAITADIDSSVQATEFIIDPKADVEKLQNNMKGRINITMSHPECNNITILYDVLPRFTLRPPLLIVFCNKSEEPIKKDVWILNNYSEDFEVESTSSKEGYIKVLNQKKISNSYQFELEITPPQPEDEMKFTDVFYINIKDGEKLAIACRGIYSGRQTAVK